jgi:Flp pilus assembly protein TadG
MKRLRSTRGQSLVEFALVLPILFVLLCAILDFGWLLGNKLLAEYGSREGARYAAVNVTLSDLNARVEEKVLDAMPGFTHEGLDISVACTNHSHPRDGDVTVDVDYTFKLLTPFAMTLFGSQEYTVGSKCTMKAE